MCCHADIVHCIAGTPFMTDDSGLTIPTSCDASLGLQTVYLGSEAVYFAHAGLTLQSTDSLGRHTSTTTAPIRPPADLIALLPGSYTKLGGGATSLTILRNNTSQTYWNSTIGKSPFLLVACTPCINSALIVLALVYTSCSSKLFILCMLCSACMSVVTGTSTVLD